MEQCSSFLFLEPKNQEKGLTQTRLRENPCFVFPFFFFLIFSNFILFYLFLLLAVLGLRCCTWTFSSCGKQGLLLVVVHGLLTVVASLVVEHGP